MTIEQLEELRYIISMIDVERNMMGEEIDPHPSAYGYRLDDKGGKSSADIF